MDDLMQKDAYTELWVQRHLPLQASQQPPSVPLGHHPLDDSHALRPPHQLQQGHTLGAAGVDMNSQQAVLAMMHQHSQMAGLGQYVFPQTQQPSYTATMTPQQFQALQQQQQQQQQAAQQTPAQMQSSFQIVPNPGAMGQQQQGGVGARRNAGKAAMQQVQIPQGMSMGPQGMTLAPMTQQSPRPLASMVQQQQQREKSTDVSLDPDSPDGGSKKGKGGDIQERRLLKNREAAKECRRKKKEYVKCLEDRVRVLEAQNIALISELKKLKGLVGAGPMLPGVQGVRPMGGQMQ